MAGSSKLDEYLKIGFGWLGGFVGRHKFIFLVSPVVLSLVLSTGLLRVQYSTDPDHLVTPINSEGKHEKAIAERYFPTNFSDFDATRSVKFGLYGYVMVTARNGRSILNYQVWSDVRLIQKLILDLEVEYQGRGYRYSDICAKWNGECYTNSLLPVADTLEAFSRGIFREPMESYLGNFSEQLSPYLGNDVNKISWRKSLDIFKKIEKIEIITNQTMKEIKDTFKILTQAVHDFENLKSDLYQIYEDQVKPSIDAINLPAYFGGITLKNKTLESIDFCQIISYLTPSAKQRRMDCTNPVEIGSALSDFFLQEEEKAEILKRIPQQIESALKSVQLEESADQILHVLKDVKLNMQDLTALLEETVDKTDMLNLNKLVEAEAVLIGGLLDSDTYPEVGVLWELEFLRTINSLVLNQTKATALISHSLEFEMIEGVNRIKPILIANIVAMILFSMAVCFTNDVVTSKPWLGLAGVVSTVLATFSSFGLLIYLGAEFTNFNYGAVFIMIGVGLDDTFVVLNSWEQSDSKSDVPGRLKHTMSEAGVSILITSLTDVLSFYTAILTPYPYVKIFCLYSGTSVLFLFLFQITFFSACLAWSGEHEEEGRSGFTLKYVDTEKRYTECLCLPVAVYQVNPSPSAQKKKLREASKQASRIASTVMRSRTTRITVLFLFTGYIAASIYGILNVSVYFDKSKLINFDSSMTQFIELEERLFRDNSFSISVMVTGDLLYSDPRTIKTIDTLLQRLENSSHINPYLTKSWIRHFQTVSTAKEFLLNKTQVFTTEEMFVNTVFKFYTSNNSPYRLDIRFNPDRTRIEASRFIIQGKNIHSTIDEERMVNELRGICREFSATGSMDVHVFNSYFIYIDQYLTIFKQTLLSILTTMVVVIAVSLVLLPDLLAAVCTVICIVSTLVGTMGLMSLWGIVLDGITLINLVMCIGFSVDFSTHFCYHYIDIKQRKGSSDVVGPTLVSVTKPILQGGLSTVLGLVGLLFAPSRGFIIFFKMIFIVISLGIFHSLVLLPCLIQYIVDTKKWIQRQRAPAPTLHFSAQDNKGYEEY